MFLFCVCGGGGGGGSCVSDISYHFSNLKSPPIYMKPSQLFVNTENPLDLKMSNVTVKPYITRESIQELIGNALYI